MGMSHVNVPCGISCISEKAVGAERASTAYVFFEIAIRRLGRLQHGAVFCAFFSRDF